LKNLISILDSYWDKQQARYITKTEAKVYSNIDSLEKMPSFRRTMAIATFLLAGYTSFGPFELGPAAAFYSFNPGEGFKLRLGGRTTPKLSKRLYFEGPMAPMVLKMKMEIFFEFYLFTQ
jgi:hypothetical protein